MITYAVAAILASTVGAVGLVRFGHLYTHYRGTRLVGCPATGEPTALTLAAGRAGLSGLYRAPAVRVRTCSGWPERAGCAQKCIGQVMAAPDDCRVERILTRWYQGKTCACCGRPLKPTEGTRHKPCFMGPDQRIYEWKEIQPQAIPKVLGTHSPVCWNCLVAETHIW